MSKPDDGRRRSLGGRVAVTAGAVLAAVLLLISPATAGTNGPDPNNDQGNGSGHGHGWGHGWEHGNPLAVRVQHGRLVGRHGETVRLLGVNRSGTQYQCVQGGGVFDGPTDTAALQAIRDWGANAVRVALNEHCWLGINSITPVGGEAYRAAIRDYVDRLNAVGLQVVLDLHWNAPGDELSTDQQPMADRDHAPDFWRSVAETFRDNRSVVFDLYNEPHPLDNADDPGGAEAWACVRDGGTCPGVPFEAAGMQEMLDAVRSTGARNVVMVAGPMYAGTLDQWRAYRPYDPLRQLAASVHIYFNTPDSPDWSPCYQQSCWEQTIAPLARHTPVVISELGERDCSSGLIDGTTMTPPQDSLLDWADAHGVSYLAWSWMTSDCAGEPALISDYDGTPTAYGAGIRDHLLGLRDDSCHGRSHRWWWEERRWPGDDR